MSKCVFILEIFKSRCNFITLCGQYMQQKRLAGRSFFQNLGSQGPGRVNPSGSLRAAPSCRFFMLSWGLMGFTVIMFRPIFHLEMPPRIIVVQREVGFSTCSSRRMKDMDPPVPCFAIVEGYGPLWFDPKLLKISVREKIQSFGGSSQKAGVLTSSSFC